MTRERIPDATTLQKAYGVLDRYKINRSFFVKTDQEGCAIAASDLNAALGIASTSTNVDQTAEVDNREQINVKSQPVGDILFRKENEISEIENPVTTESESKDAKSEESIKPKVQGIGVEHLEESKILKTQNHEQA